MVAAAGGEIRISWHFHLISLPLRVPFISKRRKSATFRHSLPFILWPLHDTFLPYLIQIGHGPCLLNWTKLHTPVLKLHQKDTVQPPTLPPISLVFFHLTGCYYQFIPMCFETKQQSFSQSEFLCSDVSLRDPSSHCLPFILFICINTAAYLSACFVALSCC